MKSSLLFDRKQFGRLGFASVVLASFTAIAQPVPKLTTLSQDWLQRGTTNEITLTGESLAGASRIVFSGDAGLSASIVAPEKPSVNIEASIGGISTADTSDDKKLTARFIVPADATLRPREVRVVTPSGISNPLTLNVSHLPEIAEKEPNNSTNQAQWIDLPVAVSGKIKAAAEVDYYRFKAMKDQRLVFEVQAFRIGSPMDSSLALLDDSGKELARSEDAIGLDSLIEWTAPADGEYLLQLRDFRYQGGGDFRYRLIAGALPYVDSVFPFGGRRGQNVTIDLKGQNLEGASQLNLHLDATAPLGPQQLRANTPRGYSNPFQFEVSDLPDFLETEPNNATNNANAVKLPVAINGRLTGEKDVDVFKFKVDRDQRLICAVEARRFGSPLDALLILSDASGKILQQNDDADGADARIDFGEFKKDGEYFLTIRDLQDRSGDSFAYRITIREPAPDFSARALPDAPRVRRGGHATLRCEVSRATGFGDTVRVAVTELPPGLFAEALLLPPDAGSGLLVVSASKDAALGTFPIKLEASGLIGGKLVTRTVEPLSNDRPAKQAFITILEAAPFTLDASAFNVVLEQDQSASVEVFAQRREGFTGEIKLSAEGFSAGRDPVTRHLEVSEVTLKGNEARASLKLKARLDSEVGTRTIVLRGESTIDGQTITQYSQAIPVTLSEFPFVLTPNLKKLSLTALPPGTQSAAGEASLIVKVARRGGFTNEVTFTLDGVPEGITANLEKIPANGSETTIKLVASEKAPAGKEFTLTLTGAGLHNDRTFRQKTAPIALTVAAPAEEAVKAASK
ncbi:MAG: PPC domain-containing protein [Verrucomicrobia bacterium]|nr:PPC domain-containing protein [Verrucomicrobiota bacterium]